MAASRPIAVPGAAGPVFVAEAPARVRPDVRLIEFLARGHLVVDVERGSLSAPMTFPRAAREHGALTLALPTPRDRA